MAKEDEKTKPPVVADKSAKRTSPLNLGKKEMLRVRLYNGKHELLSIEDALKDYNWNRLSPSTQKNITEGRTAVEIRQAM